MEFLENVQLAPYTTFNIGGPARWFAVVASESDLIEGVDFAKANNLRLFVLGGGSNLLVSDRGFPGLVLHIKLRGIRQRFDEDCLLFQVEAGEDWNEFVSYTTRLDCAGIECLAGIPGTVGGTPVQNVGAYGQEVSNTIRGVRALDLHSKQFLEMSAAECQFAYRESVFNTTARGRFAVTRVDFSLTPGGAPSLRYADLQRYFQNRTSPPSLDEVADAVRAIRREKGMFLVEGDPDCRSAGSFFKNPAVGENALIAIAAAVPSGTQIPRYPAAEGQVKLAAAWLVEQAGFSKGYARGRAAISSRHTLALVNRGGATSEEVLALSAEIASRVEEKFGAHLEREPVLVG